LNSAIAVVFLACHVPLNVHDLSTSANNPMAKRKGPSKADDSASEPYSDELNVSSPEVLEIDDKGTVVQYKRGSPDVRFTIMCPFLWLMFGRTTMVSEG
jgi:hypothetical protein